MTDRLNRMAEAVITEVDPDWDSHEFERVERLRTAARELAQTVLGRPRPEDGHEHEFVNVCVMCGQDAYRYFNPRPEVGR